MKVLGGVGTFLFSKTRGVSGGERGDPGNM
jgi:hypothetical protein